MEDASGEIIEKCHPKQLQTMPVVQKQDTTGIVSKFLRGVTAEMAPMKWKLRVLWKSSCVGWGFAGANPWRKVLLKWTRVWKAEADSCRNVCWSSTGERLFCWSKHERTRGVRFFTNDTRVLAALHFVVELHVLGLHREMGSKNPVGLWYSFFLP